jgi:hypothetical protein
MMRSSMSLETNYELLEMMHDDGVQSFRAREMATGRPLEVHLFIPFGRPDNKVLFEKLRSLPVDLRRSFLDLGLDGSTPYIVTDPLPEKGFRGWAANLIAGTAKPQASQPQKAGRTAVDDSVRIIQAGQWRTGTPFPEGLVTPPKAPPPPPAPAPAPFVGDITTFFQAPVVSRGGPPAAAPPPAPASAPTGGGGEFTHLFQAFQEPAAAPPAPPVPEPAPFSEPESEPGEFTRMFTASPAPPPAERLQPPPPAKPPDPDAAGEFTRMFQTGLVQRNPPPPPVEQPPAPGTHEGEFTKFFQSPLQPQPVSPQFQSPLAPPPQAPPPPKRSSEFTGVFGKPPQPNSEALPQMPMSAPTPLGGGGFHPASSATGAFSAPPPQSMRPVPSGFSGPSEYTKLMSINSAPTLGRPAPPPPAPLAPAPANKSMVPVFILLGALAVIAILVVLFFALRTK